MENDEKPVSLDILLERNLEARAQLEETIRWVRSQAD